MRVSKELLVSFLLEMGGKPVPSAKERCFVRFCRPIKWCIAWSVLGLSAVACHDAPRKNPFDPVLTPAVNLSVALDDTLGAVTLDWTPYVGEQAFARYLVLRRVAESVRVDTLAQIAMVDSTVFVDGELVPDTAYEYWVAVLNSQGFAVDSSVQLVEGFSINAVRLLPVEADVEAGVLALRWSQYRDPDFVQYRLWRRLLGTDSEEQVFAAAEVTDTVYVDAEVRAGAEYAYRVQTEAAGNLLESNAINARLDLPAVEILAVDFDAVTAAATLRWSRYTGPRFGRYQVRRTVGSVEEVIAEGFAAVDDTMWVDRELDGNTEYSYQVQVMTEEGEELNSEAASGRLHAFVAAWPVELTEVVERALYLTRGGALVVDPNDSVFEVDEKGRDYKLYEESGNIHLLTNANEIGGAELRSFSKDGALLAADNVLSTHASVRDMVMDDEGRRFIAMMDQGSRGGFSPRLKSWALFAADTDWAAVYANEVVLSGDELNMDQNEEHGTVLGSVTLQNTSFAVAGAGFVVTDVELRNLRISQSGVLVDQQLDPANALEIFNAPGWDFIDLHPLTYRGARLWDNGFSMNFQHYLQRMEDSWQNLRLEVDVRPSIDSSFRIVLGDSVFSRFALEMDVLEQEVALDWEFTPPDGSSAQPVEQRLTVPFNVFPHVDHRLVLDTTEGAVRAEVASPVLWSGQKDPDLTLLTSHIANLGGKFAFTADDQAFVVDDQGEGKAVGVLPGWVSDIRLWEVEGQRGRLMGVCMPEEHRIILGNAPPPVLADRWTQLLIQEIGPHTGSGDGSLNYPLAFAAGPDGRIYVLDAGNSRIVVFDNERNYVTQWGRRGSGPGEFDFGTGIEQFKGRDLHGSIYVDDESFVYVADPGNRRIQKFAP